MQDGERLRKNIEKQARRTEQAEKDRPTVLAQTVFLGTLGLFSTLLFLFIRLLPMISIFEMRGLLPEAGSKEVQA